MNLYIIEVSNGLVFTSLVTVEQLAAIVESIDNVVAVYQYNEDGSLVQLS